MNTQFIHVLLCDNDFSQVLEEASTRVFESLGNAAPAETFRQCVMILASALHDLRSAALGRTFGPGVATYKYLDSAIRVVYDDKSPTLDHDGGSVAIDCNTGFVWRF